MAERKKQRDYAREYKKVETWEQVGMLVDLAILRELKKGNAHEGSRIGLKEIGLPASEIQKRLGDAQVTKTQVAGRLSSLHQLKLVTPVVIFPTSAGKGWQVTKKGEEVLKEHGHKLGPEKEGA